MKPSVPQMVGNEDVMPPTRGHDLKHPRAGHPRGSPAMPPTRGHDLKRQKLQRLLLYCDAPHTGARLETGTTYQALAAYNGCPPHGGTT